MDLIYTDSNFTEKGYLNGVSMDMEIGKYSVSQNDFELTVPIDSHDPVFNDGSLFYCEETEYGGMIDHKKVSTSSNTITFKGKTFRGMLEKEYVQPNDGSAYLVMNGEANTCINALITGRFDDLFVVDDIGSSGISVNYQIRDLNLLESIENMLLKSSAKIDIRHMKDGKVHLKAVPINDMSEQIQYDRSYQISMNIETKIKPYNHVLALGKGELTDRIRVNLYMQNDGSWSIVKTADGINRKSYKYEDTNEEDQEKLISNAIAKVNELNGTDSLDISFDADNAELFDIVSAKEDITGISFKQKITQKIIKINGNAIDISYKVGESK